MTERGLVDVPDASARFLVDRRPGVPGSAVAAVLEGARPLLVEVQALVDAHRRAGAAPRRRRAWSPGAWRCCSPCSSGTRACSSTGADVYASVAGGVRVTERGLDLALALAVAGAQLGAAVTRDTVVGRRGRPRGRGAVGAAARASPRRGGAARVSRARSSRRARRDVRRAPAWSVVPVSSVGHAVERGADPRRVTPGEPGVTSAILVASPSTDEPTR